MKAKKASEKGAFLAFNLLVISTALRGYQENFGKLKGTESVFFPGCSLSLNSPHLVKKSFSFLQEQFPGIGILTGCCGAPTHLIGEQTISGDIVTIVFNNKPTFP